MKKTCAQPGCGAPLRSTNTLGYCMNHRTETSRAPKRVCAVDGCETKLLASNTLGWCKVHINPCDREERNACAHCGTRLNAHNKSGYCYLHHIPANRAERRTCAEDGCNRRIRLDNVTGWCHDHSMRNLAAERSAKYKAKKLRLWVEPVNREEVLNRSGDKCHICGDPVGPGWHMDHVIPLSLGGPHCYTNVAPAHAFCNGSKQARWSGSPVPEVDAAARKAYADFHGKPFTD